MKLLVVSALLCALMALTTAADLAEETSKEAQGAYLVKRLCYHGHWHKFRGRYFKYFPTHMTWAEAEKMCETVGGNLASVHDVHEYHVIQKMILSATHAQNEAWIGGCDAAQEGIWLWSDGSHFTYSNWCPGEPNNGLGRGQNCLQMNFSGSKCWDDLGCSVRRPFVCAKKR